jgi:hypothetical protein
VGNAGSTVSVVLCARVQQLYHIQSLHPPGQLSCSKTEWGRQLSLTFKHLSRENVSISWQPMWSHATLKEKRC